MSGAFRVLPPVFRSFGAVAAFAGPVSTVKCHEDNTHVKAAVESPGEGRVLVVDGGGSLRRALVGGNLAAAAARNGWAGVVVDGCVRDVAELNAAAVGLRALALMPRHCLADPKHRLAGNQRPAHRPDRTYHEFGYGVP